MTTKQAIRKTAQSIADELNEQTTFSPTVVPFGKSPTDMLVVLNEGIGISGYQIDKLRERGFELAFSLPMDERPDKLVFKRRGDE